MADRLRWERPHYRQSKTGKKTGQTQGKPGIGAHRERPYILFPGWVVWVNTIPSQTPLLNLPIQKLLYIHHVDSIHQSIRPSINLSIHTNQQKAGISLRHSRTAPVPWAWPFFFASFCLGQQEKRSAQKDWIVKGSNPFLQGRHNAEGGARVFLHAFSTRKKRRYQELFILNINK